MSDWFDAEAHADRAFEMYERGRWDEAESELRKALALNPDQAEWHFNLGLTLEAAGRDHDALASYQRAIELMHDQPDPLVAAGIVANRLGQHQQAIEWFEEALRFDRAHEGAYCNKIESHIRLGDHDQAEATFYMAQYEVKDPSASCLAVMAESLTQRGEYEKAAWCLKEAMRHDPGIPRLRARLGNVYAALGKPQRALQLYLRDLRDDPGNIDTLLDYGELLVEFNRLPEAAEKFRRVLEIEPANVDAHARLGEIAMRCRRYERAQLEFEVVLKLDPDYPQIRVDLAEALLRRGMISEARRHLLDEFETVQIESAEHAIRQEETGTSPDRHHDRAAGPFSTLDSAAGPFKELRRFGALLLKADLPMEAARIFEQAGRTRRLTTRQRTNLLRQLALARFRAGDRHGGAAVSRRVLRLDPTCTASLHNLALAALEDDRLDVATGWIKRGLHVNRHDDGLRRLRVRLWLARVRQGWRRLLSLTGLRAATSRP